MDLFSSRRAIERLRDGLFDPVAVSRLNMDEDQIKKTFSKGLKALEKGKSDHLCICGSYGQGKSHNLINLNKDALSQGYATSLVQLDIRETPFHQFSVVYQALMEKLSLPDGEKFVVAWKKWGKTHSLDILDSMPHRFRMILMAMLSPNNNSSKKKNKQPVSSCWLEKVLNGHNLPVSHLKSLLEGVEGYKNESLNCRGSLPYVLMILALGKLLKEMGYKGLVLFFDEAESIAQGRLRNRLKSYEILDHFFKNKGFIYPVFAVTDDFFDKIKNEQYDDEEAVFPKNYSEAWDLNVVRLQDFSSDKWKILQNRLIQLYAESYRIDLSNQMVEIKEKLQNVLEKHKDQETRFKLKALVNQLDIETQNQILDLYKKKSKRLNLESVVV